MGNAVGIGSREQKHTRCLSSDKYKPVKTSLDKYEKVALIGFLWATGGDAWKVKHGWTEMDRTHHDDIYGLVFRKLGDFYNVVEIRLSNK